MDRRDKTMLAFVAVMVVIAITLVRFDIYTTSLDKKVSVEMLACSSSFETRHVVEILLCITV